VKAEIADVPHPRAANTGSNSFVSSAPCFKGSTIQLFALSCFQKAIHANQRVRNGIEAAP
jgi:hypothetical protein